MPLYLPSVRRFPCGTSPTRAVELPTLTRRSFMAFCVLGYSRALGAMRPMQPGENWALISDTHISSSLDRTVLRSCMSANLERVVAQVIAAQPDRVLFNGDLAFATGEQNDYDAFRALISPLRDRDIPLHLTLGNHDHRARLLQSFDVEPGGCVGPKASSRVMIGGVEWFFLDSLEKVDAVRGRLGLRQRTWLAEQLDSNQDVPAVICLHHNPDRSVVGLRDAKKFRQIVLPRRRVKLVLFGHTHTFRHWRSAGLHFVNLPATGYSFKPGNQLGWIWARIGEEGMRLELRGIDGGHRDAGATFDLSWRSN